MDLLKNLSLLSILSLTLLLLTYFLLQTFSELKDCTEKNRHIASLHYCDTIVDRENTNNFLKLANSLIDSLAYRDSITEPRVLAKSEMMTIESTTVRIEAYFQTLLQSSSTSTTLYKVDTNLKATDSKLTYNVSEEALKSDIGKAESTIIIHEEIIESDSGKTKSTITDQGQSGDSWQRGDSTSHSDSSYSMECSISDWNSFLKPPVPTLKISEETLQTVAQCKEGVNWNILLKNNYSSAIEITSIRLSEGIKSGLELPANWKVRLKRGKNLILNCRLFGDELLKNKEKELSITTSFLTGGKEVKSTSVIIIE